MEDLSSEVVENGENRKENSQKDTGCVQKGILISLISLLLSVLLTIYGEDT